jgi:hypothetical protein
MPLNQIAFGLVDHNIKFFSVNGDHYVEWQTIMSANFGRKWDKLFRGPIRLRARKTIRLRAEKLIKQHCLPLEILLNCS